MKLVSCIHSGRLEIQFQFLIGNRLDSVGVLPSLRPCSSHIVSHSLLEKLGFRSTLHRPIIPFPMQLVKIYKTRLSKGQPTHLFLRSPSSRMIPRPYDQVMITLCRSGTIFHVPPVKLQCTRLIPIIMTSDCQNWHVHSVIVPSIWGHSTPIVIGRVVLGYPITEDS